jgi:hypothetical protein
MDMAQSKTRQRASAWVLGKNAGPGAAAPLACCMFVRFIKRSRKLSWMKLARFDY